MSATSPNLRLVRSPTKEPKKVESVLDLIGNTPLLEIQRITDGIPARVKVYAKLEGLNPGGSVKDRPAWRMVQEGLRTRQAARRQNDPRLDFGKYRYCAGDDRQRARLSGGVGDSRQRQQRAQT